MGWVTWVGPWVGLSDARLVDYDYNSYIIIQTCTSVQLMNNSVTTVFNGS